MNDEADQQQAVDQGQAEHLQGDPHQAWKTKAFRLTVARLWAHEGLDTQEIAKRMGCDEAAVYNVLQKAKEMIR